MDNTERAANPVRDFGFAAVNSFSAGALMIASSSLVAHGHLDIGLAGLVCALGSAGTAAFSFRRGVQGIPSATPS